jgi:hypothetical protein
MRPYAFTSLSGVPKNKYMLAITNMLALWRKIFYSRLKLGK